MSELRELLQGVLRQHLQLLPTDGSFDPNAELRELGLDSMTAISLLLDLEKAFEITFPDEMLEAETFRTAETLAAAVEKLIAESSEG